MFCWAKLKGMGRRCTANVPFANVVCTSCQKLRGPAPVLGLVTQKWSGPAFRNTPQPPEIYHGPIWPWNQQEWGEFLKLFKRRPKHGGLFLQLSVFTLQSALAFYSELECVWKDVLQQFNKTHSVLCGKMGGIKAAPLSVRQRSKIP